MKQRAWLTLLLLPLLVACEPSTPEQTTTTAEPSQPVATAPSFGDGFTGKVLETMSTAQYTYAKVATDQGEIWCAGPRTPLKQGDEVLASGGMVMKDFTSKSLNRTFDSLVFVDGLMVAGAEPPGIPATSADGLPAGHPPLDGMQAGKDPGMVGGLPGLQKMTPTTLPEIPKAEGGYTVADVFAQKEALAGKEVTIRAMVVKFNPQIMGINWLHLQDGTGEPGTNDLTITSSETVEVGKVALVTGTLSVDKDFGYGYKYDVIVENARIVAE